MLMNYVSEDFFLSFVEKFRELVVDVDVGKLCEVSVQHCTEYRNTEYRYVCTDMT
jgi:hypothetical protein